VIRRTRSARSSVLECVAQRQCGRPAAGAADGTQLLVDTLPRTVSAICERDRIHAPSTQ